MSYQHWPATETVAVVAQDYPIVKPLTAMVANVPPRAWVERNLGKTLIHWTEMPRGGHFAALEQPQLLVEDVRAFFRKIEPKP